MVSGTIYLMARYYNSDLGRFTQEDPIRDGSNWYAYCGNNPIMFVDPSGNTSKVNFSADGYAYDGFKIDDANKGGGNYRRELQMVGNALGTVELITLTVKAGELIAENPPLPLHKQKAMVEAKAKAEAETKTEAEAREEQINKEHPELYTVYFLADANGNIRYVGRTKNLAQRMRAHRNPKSRTSKYVLCMYFENLTYTQARGIEELGIEYYATHNSEGNLIHGIGENNKNYSIYMNSAYDKWYNRVTNLIYVMAEGG